LNVQKDETVLGAICAYLRTLKPVVNRVTGFPDRLAGTY
jgi:hypothetical protein